MRDIIMWLIICVALFASQAQAKNNAHTIYVDKTGVMRWNDTEEEASFFGVNYTAPFAHAYRMIQNKGLSHKLSIDQDVYHLTRLGINAYRIHVWDVEISDHAGNLIENEHIDLLDYLISELEKHNISIVITAQTNFGNGYPEKNIATGGFSYDYDKCDIHKNPKAIAAQKKYVAALISHVNKYTGVAYKDDNSIVGYEINNEPCHTGDPKITKNYIATMVKAMRSTGCKKPIFYNVSHNMEHVQSYFDSDIQGTTYQWYPIGLVSNHMKSGNFLPYIDEYKISFSNVRGFNKMAKLVYEFDPADILYSYMYPAIVRTFRSAGFQWITQFAYDPLDIASTNTEYQTHYLNLAYTPAKAISIKIAVEAAKRVKRNEKFDKYPADTLFNGVRVSYTQDLSELNVADKYFYSNSTNTKPINTTSLSEIAGVKSSPIVKYTGTGAYFIDKLKSGVWRLEIMPDAITVADPFSKTSPDRDVVVLQSSLQEMSILLPDLGDSYKVKALNKGNNYSTQAVNSTMRIKPGTYIIYSPAENIISYSADSAFKTVRLGDYVGGNTLAKDNYIINNQPYVSHKGDDITINTTIVSATQPDSVVIYDDKISFWNDKNPYIKMTKTGAYTYSAIVPEANIKGDVYRYNIVVYDKVETRTYPSEEKCSPLSWNYIGDKFYEIKIVDNENVVTLLSPAMVNQIDALSMQETSWVQKNVTSNSLLRPDGIKLSVKLNANDTAKFAIRNNIKHILEGRNINGNAKLKLNILNHKDIDTMRIGMISKMGITYACDVEVKNGIITIPLSNLKQVPTLLLPLAYPVFVPRIFTADVNIPATITDMETLELAVIKGGIGEPMIEISGAWIEK